MSYSDETEVPKWSLLFFFLFYVSDVVRMDLDQLAGLVPLVKKIVKTLHSVPRTKVSWQAGRFFILINFGVTHA